MKKVILLLFISFSGSDAQLLEENFDYIAGVLTAVTANWSESPIGSTDIQVFNENLFFPGYQSSNIGNLIMLDGGATGRSGISRTFTAQSTAGSTVYWSFLLNVTSTAEMDSSGGMGDYFLNFQNSAMTQNKSYIYLKQGSDSSKYCIGLAKASSASLLWHVTELNVNTTYLIVAGYSIVSGTGNDISKLWVNPALTGDEPAADLTVSAGTDAPDIGVIQFRQRPLSGDMKIDGVRVAASWSQGPLPVELASFTCGVSGNKVELYWETSTEVNNYGFDVERKTFFPDENWRKIGFVLGSGTSSSTKFYSFTDEPLNGREFGYRLKQIDFDGAFEYSKPVTAVLVDITAFELEQNFPNPFNPSTIIQYTIPRKSDVRLTVYNLIAQQVAELFNGSLEAGRYNSEFDGTGLPSGVYFCKLTAGEYTEMRKLLLLR